MEEPESEQSTNKIGRDLLIVLAVFDGLLVAVSIQYLVTSRWEIYSAAMFGLMSVFFLFASLALWLFIFLLNRCKTSQSVLTVSCLGLLFLVFLATWLLERLVFGPMLIKLLPH